MLVQPGLAVLVTWFLSAAIKVNGRFFDLVKWIEYIYTLLICIVIFLEMTSSSSAISSPAVSSTSNCCRPLSTFVVETWLFLLFFCPDSDRVVTVLLSPKLLIITISRILGSLLIATHRSDLRPLTVLFWPKNLLKNNKKKLSKRNFFDFS